MNLAIRGITGNLGEVPADTFFKDQHPDLKADYIMADPQSHYCFIRLFVPKLAMGILLKSGENGV